MKQVKSLNRILLVFFVAGVGFAQPEIKTYKATLDYESSALLGEGAFWNHQNNTLLWIDIEGKQLNIYNPITRENEFIEAPLRIGTVVPIDETNVLVALEDGVYKLDLSSKDFNVFTDMTDVLSEARLNDGKCDPKGRFWVGSMHWKQLKNKAKLFMINHQGELKVKIDEVTISNGIVWTSDKRTMYYIDTPTSSIKAFDYDNETAAISNGRVVVKISNDLGYPDGMTIDDEGMLWVGMWNGNAVLRFNPKTGILIGKVEVPAHNVTSCAFGGVDLDTLYITTARVDMTDTELKKHPLSGSVFKVVPGVKGVKSYFFKQEN